MRGPRPLFEKKLQVKKAVSYLTAFLLCYVLMILVPFMPAGKVGDAFDETFDAAAFRGGETGQRARILDDGELAFRARLALLESARRSVRIATFDITDDRVTRIFFGAVFSAQKRGVSVRLVCDGMFARPQGRTGFIDEALLALGGEYYLYAPLDLWAPTTINDSLHDKYLTADGTGVVLGGRNIGERYFFETGGNAAYDRDVLVLGGGEGSAARQVEAYFDATVSARQVKRVERSFSEKKRQTLLDKAGALIGEYEAYRRECDPQTALDDTIEVGKVTLLTNSLDYGVKEPRIFEIFCRLMESGQPCILQTPYTSLLSARRDRFLRAAQNGNVTMLTNSLASSPNLPAFSQYLLDRKRYARSGLSVYEFQSDALSIHAKTLVAGEDLTIIGSFNMDERSIQIDTESALVIEGEAFNRQMRAVLKGYIDQSAKVGPDGSYIQGASIRPRAGKTFLFWAAGIVLRPFRFLT